MQVSKTPIVAINQDDDDVTIQPGFLRSIRNLIPRRAGLSKAAGGQNVPGTLLRVNPSLPSGTNTCIGTFEDRANNRIFYFIHNSLNEHGVWYFDPNTNTHTKVFQGSGLNFSLSYPVNSVDCIEDILQWTDRYNEPRSILVSDALSGLYTNSYFDMQSGLQKENPFVRPLAQRSTIFPSVSINNVCSDSYQFCYRFIYNDNTASFFSPWSTLIRADIVPNVNSSTDNQIIMEIDNVQLSALNIARSIQWAYMKNGDGNVYIFKETAVNPAVSFYLTTFRGTEPAEQVPPFELEKTNFVPQKSGSVLINNQRSIVTMDEFDSGFEEEGGSTLYVTPVDCTDAGQVQLHMPGATYSYGIVYFDARMRTNGVVKKVDVTFPVSYGDGAVGISYGDLWASWSITGTPPSWARYYVIVRRKNSTISSVFQVPAVVMFYKRDGDTAGAGELVDDGKVFYNSKPPSAGAYTGRLHWKLPINIPVSLDDSYSVRLTPNIGQTKTEPIIEVIGDKIVTGNFGVTNWSGTSANRCTPVLQIEKTAAVVDPKYFEVSDIYSITGGTHSTVSGVIKGDMHAFSFSGFIYESIESGSLSYTAGASGTAEGFQNAQILSQSPTTASVVKEVTTTEIQKVRYYDVFQDELIGSDSIRPNGPRPLSYVDPLIRAPFGPTGVDEQGFKTINLPFAVSSAKRVYTLDYTKICSENGRSWIEVKNKQTANEPTTISISDKYVLNSGINGMSRLASMFTLPPNRSPIKKLVNIGASGMFIAIHERTVTSMAPYSGDKFAPTSDGSQVQDALNTNSIIAYENELAGGYGTSYPESVVEHGGRVYWFDPYKGEACRYAANGVTPIGSVYKMKTFFRQKGSEFINTSGRSVVGGYDPNLSMFTLTFKSSVTDEEETIGFIDRPGEERWVSFFDYKPIRYAKINNRMFSFVGGEMWEHNATETYNNFYGVQYKLELDFVFNTEPSSDKVLKSISVEGSEPLDFTSIKSKRAQRNDQETVLMSSAFIRKDDVFYADVRRNKYTPGLSVGDGISRGDILIGRKYEAHAETGSSNLVEVEFVNFNYIKSMGHMV